jgi:hypothetical protein
MLHLVYSISEGRIVGEGIRVSDEYTEQLHNRRRMLDRNKPIVPRFLHTMLTPENRCDCLMHQAAKKHTCPSRDVLVYRDSYRETIKLLQMERLTH